MANQIKMTLVLTGAREGVSVTVGKMYEFVDGKLTIQGSSHDVHNLAHYLAVNYQAYEEGSEELEAYYGSRVEVQETETERDEKSPVFGDELPDGEGSSELSSLDGAGSNYTSAGDSGPDSEGDGSKGARIFEVVKQLDRGNDDHWVTEGSPKIAAVEELLGEHVTRKEIDAAAFGFNRGT